MKHTLTSYLVLTGLLPMVGLAATNSAVKLTAPEKAPAPVVAKPAATNEVKKPLLAVAKPAATNEVKKPLLAVAKPVATNEVKKPLLAEAKPVATNEVKKPLLAEMKPDAEKADAPVEPTTDDEDKVTPDAEEAEKNPSAASAVPVKDDPQFARYKTIMDRMPFGPEPANFDPDKPGSGSPLAGGKANGMDGMSDEAVQSAAEQQILSSVRVSAINVTPSGKIAVGFTDGTKQPSGSYYIKVGEESDGWKVLEADPKELTVKLEKEGVSATLKLGEGATDGKGGAKKPGGPGMIGGLNRQSLSGGGMRPMLGARPGQKSPSADAGSALANLRARRQRKEAERQAEAAQVAQAAEQAKQDRANAAAEREKAAAEREQQREALLQIQEELRKQREAREQQQQQQQQGQQPVAPQE